MWSKVVFDIDLTIKFKAINLKKEMRCVCSTLRMNVSIASLFSFFIYLGPNKILIPFKKCSGFGVLIFNINDK